MAQKPPDMSQPARGTGIAREHWRESDFDALQQPADAALYAAKRNGRDGVVLDGPPGD